VDGQWQRLPRYVAGVFEGALRSGARYASVFVGGGIYEPIYLIADLESFTAGLWSSKLRRHIAANFTPKNYVPMGPSHRLTRFLRGRPSSTPDLRTPKDLDRALMDEDIKVDEVAGAEAVHVRTIVGKVVFSAAKADVILLLAQDVLDQIGIVLGKQPRQLSLALDERVLGQKDCLEPLLAQAGDLELLVLVGDDDEPVATRPEEWIPEDVPGRSDEIQEYMLAVKRALNRRR